MPALKGRRCPRGPRPRHVVDGIVTKREHLERRPVPDTLLEGASALDVEPRAATVVDDALPEVAAGPDRRFRCVVRVDRVGQADALRGHGGDVVVSDLAELLGRP
jgi:beta-phosphoglucomutase-like phosphatase (HAD superfamily)